ncbi:hypothetical protein CkaCkLH20_09324 [Colletotrichum karsti]|uniref:Uncharacterized protein n=1 Tax=Colletotrichum karsti TaxID=1095194 RepID=A0A9P6I1J1_9PEZI|nr:uncharacterized protein CkaCkLH20_09324 [Colletotrichum karsti]KAF9873161.1 hypothetical protein CkaCkLH20_09324 [Colletotrichum karsti]
MSILSDLSPGLFPRDPGTFECQTARAPDYYGLGNRLGIYFAWGNAYIANTMLASEIAGASDTNNIFLLVILIAMIKCSSAGMLTHIDGLILMHLSGGFLFGTLSMWGYRTRQYFDNGPQGIRFFGGFGTHSRLIVSCMISSYGLWYWMYGVVGGLVHMGSPEETGDLEVDPPNPPECETLYTFMFAKVRADGGIRIFYIIMCIGCIIYYGTMLLISSIAGWARATRMLSLFKQKRWAESSRLKFATGFKYRELEVLFRWLRWLNLAFLIYSMLLVEFTLNFNHVNAVLGGPHNNELHLPAQLLPLLIGSFGFVRTCYLLFESWRSPEDIDPSLSAPPTPVAARTMHTRDVLLLFSPAMARRPTTFHDPDEIDKTAKQRGWPVRYLVAWLPWLSLLGFFQERPALEDRKRHSKGSENSERVDSKTSAEYRTRRSVSRGV